MAMPPPEMIGRPWQGQCIRMRSALKGTEGSARLSGFDPPCQKTGVQLAGRMAS